MAIIPRESLEGGAQARAGETIPCLFFLKKNQTTPSPSAGPTCFPHLSLDFVRPCLIGGAVHLEAADLPSRHEIVGLAIVPRRGFERHIDTRMARVGKAILGADGRLGAVGNKSCSK